MWMPRTDSMAHLGASLLIFVILVPWIAVIPAAIVATTVGLWREDQGDVWSLSDFLWTAIPAWVAGAYFHLTLNVELLPWTT